MPSRLDEFRFVRWANALNRVVQISLSLSLVVGLNFLAARHFERWDLTENHRFSLGAETQAYLKAIPKNAPPVHLILAIQPRPGNEAENDATNNELRALLREYQAVAEAAHVPLVTEEVDAFKQNLRTQALKSDYGLTPDALLIVAQGNNHRLLSPKDLYEMKLGEPTGFLGERAVTSAILNLVQAKPQKIYFTTGHGEMKLGDASTSAGLSRLKQILRDHNLEAQELKLTSSEGVPSDADAVIIAAPTLSLLPSEVEKLRRYLNQTPANGNRGGQILVFLPPNGQRQDTGSADQERGLGDLLHEWGILAKDRLVIEAPTARSPQGDLIISSYVKDHPITEFFLENNLQVVLGPRTRMVDEDKTTPLNERLRVTPLMAASKAAFAMADYMMRLSNTPAYDASRDVTDPVNGVPVATLAEQRSPGTLNLPGGRMIVFGNADFIDNANIDQLGNSYLLQNTLNYMLEQKNMLNIPPKPPFSFKVGVSQENVTALVWRFLLLPAGLALVGGLVYFTRHR
jgi:hypothetical protein